MNTLNIKSFAATLLTAASLQAISAHADGLAVGATADHANPDDRASNSDGGPRLFGATRVDRDVSGRDIGGSTLQLELGPQYTVTDKLTVGGEWEHFQPFFVHGHAYVEQYTFGVRVPF
jgi:hypothetical protein